MSDAAKKERIEKLVKSVRQASVAGRKSQMSPMLPFFEMLAEKIGVVLQSFSSAPVKCSVSNVDSLSLDPSTIAFHGSGFQSEKGKLNICFRGERAFDALLCEVCFGGTDAHQEHADDSSRPPSRIERLVREMIFDELFHKFPEVMLDIARINLKPMPEVKQKKKQLVQPPISFAKAVFLINVFSLSNELELLIPLDELLATVGSAVLSTKIDTRNLGAVVEACPFEVTISLSPQAIGLREILDLSIGGVIKLESTPTEPTNLEVLGKQIAKGNLQITPDSLAVSVI